VAEYAALPRGQAKIRNLWIVLLLLIVTIGLYYLYWYYAINRELRDFGSSRHERLDISPFVSLLAITIGAWILVPPFVSAWRTVKRVQIAEGLAGIQEHARIDHVFGFVLFIIGFVLFPVEVFYLQAHLNRMWRHVTDEQEKERMGMRPAGVRA
jgi:TRAP-type C4-dicarboxylate transport system permease small subunit